MYLYMLYNEVEKKGYIGITSRRPGKRFTEHLSVGRLSRDETYLARAIRKYGAEAFTLTVLRQVKSWDELKQLEMNAIAMYNTLKPHGYNLTKGGDGNYGYVPTPEHKQKLSQYWLDFYANGGVSPTLGVKRTEETKAKIRENTRKQFALTGNPMQGKKHSEETRKLISERLKGKTGWNKGKKLGPLSDEHRAKLSVVHRGQKAWNKGIPWHDITGGKEHPKARAVEFHGKAYPSVMECSRQTGFSRNTIKRVIAQGRARYLED